MLFSHSTPESLSLENHRRRKVLAGLASITHDAEGAVLLSDRVLVLEAGLGRLEREIGVDLPYPREREGALHSAHAI